MTKPLRLRPWLGCALIFVAALLPLSLRADEEPPLEELVVSGEQPGPGLWQVRYGEHRLWILGTVSPMPAKLTWRSRQVEEHLAASQVYLANIEVKADLSVFRIVSLIPAVLRARKLPKGDTLSTVLEPALYTRWHALQQRYAPHEKLEDFRPLPATYPVYEKALAAAGLGSRNRVPETILELAQKASVPVRKPKLELSIDDPKGLVREYAESPPGLEFACLDTLMTRMEHDLPLLQKRAQAWAVGDVATLRQIAAETATRDQCLDSLSTLPRIARKIEEARRRVEQEWLLAAEGALLRNDSSFAVLGMEQLLRPDGLLARLKARGYEVIEPE